MEAALAVALERIDALEHALQSQSVEIARVHDEASASTDAIWFLTCSALVFVMQAGFALVEQGCCRIRSMQSILMKNVADCIVGGLTWYMIGYGVAFGFGVDMPWIVAGDALNSTDISNYHFQCTFAHI